jgi:hypothetical protein
MTSINLAAGAVCCDLGFGVFANSAAAMKSLIDGLDWSCCGVASAPDKISAWPSDTQQGKPENMLIRPNLNENNL